METTNKKCLLLKVDPNMVLRNNKGTTHDEGVATGLVKGPLAGAFLEVSRPPETVYKQ
jgi:hypothetical protein